MTNEEKNKEIGVKLKFELEKNIKNSIFASAIFGSIGKSIKELHQLGRGIEEKTIRELNTYFTFCKQKIEALNYDEVEVCLFLRTEKRKFVMSFREADVNDNGYSKKYYQRFMDKIIDPLLKYWEEEFEFQQKLPLKKHIEITPVIEIASKPKELNTTSKVIEPSPELPEGFEQIECDASKEEILYYFGILTKEKNHRTNEFFMTEEAVIEFVNKNFSVFNSSPSGKYFPINLLPKQKGILRHFIYWFYVKYDQKEVNNKIKYAKLLTYNFDIFKDDSPETMISNISESKKPKKGAIPISKYFQK